MNTREILLSFKREDGIFPCASGLRFADAHPDPHEAIDAALAVAAREDEMTCGPLEWHHFPHQAIDAALAVAAREDEMTCGPLEWHHLRFAAWVISGHPDNDRPYNGFDLKETRARTEKAAEFLREYLRGTR